MKSSFPYGSLFVILLWLAGIGGYFANIAKLIDALGSNPVSTMFIARAIGIFVAPLGAILGYF